MSTHLAVQLLQQKTTLLPPVGKVQRQSLCPQIIAIYRLNRLEAKNLRSEVFRGILVIPYENKPMAMWIIFDKSTWS